MKALVKAEAGPGLVLRDVPEPEAHPGEVLIRVLWTGICGTDLHIRSWDAWAQTAVKPPVVLGHEFCGEVIETGPKTGKEFRPGTTVVSFPLMRAGGSIHLTGLSPHAPGAYAERVIAEASLSFAVPNGLDVGTAALTEPMAVALHAVRRSEIKDAVMKAAKEAEASTRARASVQCVGFPIPTF